MHIVLVEPEIPPNTGNIARTCAATGTTLHLIKPMGFSLEDRFLKRAGLDYWDLLELKVHESWDDFISKHQGTMYFATTKTSQLYNEMSYTIADYLVFGRETKGLPEDLLNANEKNCITIPMKPEARSLNLSTAVAIVLYEGLRQLGFCGCQ